MRAQALPSYKEYSTSGMKYEEKKYMFPVPACVMGHIHSFQEEYLCERIADVVRSVCDM